MFWKQTVFLISPPTEGRAAVAQRQHITKRIIWLRVEELGVEWMTPFGKDNSFAASHSFPFRSTVTTSVYPIVAGGKKWKQTPVGKLGCCGWADSCYTHQGYDTRTGLGSMMQTQIAVCTLSAHMWSPGCRVAFHEVLSMCVQALLGMESLETSVSDPNWRQPLDVVISAVNVPEEDIITNHTWVHSAKCSFSYLKKYSVLFLISLTYTISFFLLGI